MYTIFNLSSVNVTLPSEPGVGTLPVDHLSMLGRHCANYNKQDTEFAQLLYHLNTAHNNASVSCVGTTLVHHLQILAQRRTNNCVEDHPSLYYATCTLTHLQRITDRPCPAIGPQRWFNAGATLLVCIMNKTLAQHWVNAYISFHLYINIPFFRLTSRIDSSCQTDVALITANKLKRDDSRAWFRQYELYLLYNNFIGILDLYTWSTL